MRINFPGMTPLQHIPDTRRIRYLIDLKEGTTMKNSTLNALSIALLTGTALSAQTALAWQEDLYDGTYDVKCADTPTAHWQGEPGNPEPHASYYEVGTFSITQAASDNHPATDIAAPAGSIVIKAECDAATGKLTLAQSEQDVLKNNIQTFCETHLQALVDQINAQPWMSYTPDPNGIATACTDFANGVNATATNIFQTASPDLTDTFTVDWEYDFWAHLVGFSYGDQHTTFMDGTTAVKRFPFQYNGNQEAHLFDPKVFYTNGSCVSNTYGSEKQFFALGDPNDPAIPNTVEAKVLKGFIGKCVLPTADTPVVLDFDFKIHHQYESE